MIERGLAAAHQQGEIHGDIILQTVWLRIETYLDVVDVIKISKTCQSLHRLIVDDETEKVKVSHYEFPEHHHWRSVRAKRMVPRIVGALNNIHFPSLRRLKIDISVFDHKSYRGYGFEGANACFPLVVANLSYARNLTHLWFHAGRDHDDNTPNDQSRLKFDLFHTFGQNLAKCRKLEELEVTASYIVSMYDDDEEFEGTVYNPSLMSALIPTIQKRKNDLRCLKISVRGEPLNFSPRRMSMGESSVDEIWEKFFAAVLSMQMLHTLELSFDNGDQGNFLLNTAKEMLHCNALPSSLKSLSLELNPYRRDDISIDPLLAYFSECDHLQRFCISLSTGFWRDGSNTKSLRDFLDGKTDLSTLDILGGNHQDSTGDILGFVDGYAKSRNYKLHGLSLFALEDVNGARLCKFIQDMIDGGTPLDEEDFVVSSSSDLACYKEVKRAVKRQLGKELCISSLKMGTKYASANFESVPFW